MVLFTIKGTVAQGLTGPNAEPLQAAPVEPVLVITQTCSPSQILDWFHACEHLCEFGREYFKDEEEKNKWIEEQKALFYESKTTEVINNIISLVTTRESVETSKNKLLQYYQINKPAGL